MNDHNNDKNSENNSDNFSNNNPFAFTPIEKPEEDDLSFSEEQNSEEIAAAEEYAVKSKANSQRMKRTYSWLSFALILVIVMTFAAVFVIEFLAVLISRKTEFDISTLMIISEVSLYVFGIGSAVLLLKLLKIKPFPKAPQEREKMSVGAFLRTLAISFFAMYTGSFIGNALNGIISAISGNEIQNELDTVVNGMPMWLTVVLVVIIGPIVEELFFRKFIIDRTAVFGELTAVVYSAIFFGLFHQNFYQFFYAAMLGLILGYVYCRTGNIGYTIAMHMTINFFGSVVPLGVTKLAQLDKITDMTTEQLLSDALPSLLILLAYIFFLFCVFVTGLVFFILRVRKSKFDAPKVPLPKEKGERAKLCWANVGTIVALVFFSLVMIVSVLPIDLSI